MDIVHRQCAGLDVHEDEVVACARIVTGRRISPTPARFPTTTRGLLALREWLRAQGCAVAALEATGVYWKPVWHILEATVPLVLANPAHVRAIPGRKSDMNDATWLADLLAYGLICGSFVPPTPIQGLRDLTRARKQLGRQIAQHTLRLQKVQSSCSYTNPLPQTGHVVAVDGMSLPLIVEKGRGMNDRVEGRLQELPLRCGHDACYEEHCRHNKSRQKTGRWRAD